MMAEEELATIGGRKENLEELERDRDALLESYAEMTPGALDALTPEERRQVYGMLRLRIEVAADGTMEAQGILSENVCVQHEGGRPASEEGLCENGLASLVPTGSKPPLSQRLIMLFLLWPNSIRRALSVERHPRLAQSGT
jgi:hypothetical protein